MQETDSKISKTLQAALHIARKGLPVFPLPAGRKIPTLKGWPEAATSDATQVSTLFANHNGNIGIATGECAAGRIVVVDIDGPDGQAWIDARGILPPTLESATRRDAPGVPHRHHFYTWPVNDDMPTVHQLSTTVDGAKVAAHVDVRGARGFVVAPGSTVEGGQYRWVRECTPVPAPQWFIDEMRRQRHKERREVVHIPQHPTTTDNARYLAYGEVALRGIVDRLSGAGDGVKHSELCIAACKAGSLVPHALSMSEAANALVDVVVGWGDRVRDQQAAIATIHSGVTKGMQSPLYPPDRPMEIETISDDDVAAIISKAARGEPMPAVVQPRETRDERLRRKQRELAKTRAHQEELTSAFSTIGHGVQALVRRCSHDIFQQPHLAALGVVAIGQNWAGRRVVTRDDLLANCILIGVSGSGTGKTAAMRAFTDLAIHTASTAPATFASRQAFEAAITTSVEAKTGLTFIDDEIGVALSSVFAKNASGSKAEIAGSMLRLMPMRRGGWYQWQTSIKGGNGEVRSIECPAVSVYGTSTPTEMQSFFAGNSAENGLMGRSLIINGLRDTDPDASGSHNKTTDGFLRQQKQQAIEAQNAWAKNQPAGWGGPSGGAVHNPIRCDYTEQATEEINRLTREYTWEALDADDDAKKATLKRSAEHLERVCLCLAVAECPAMPTVTIAVVRAAHMFVSRCTDYVAPARVEAIDKIEAQTSVQGKCTSRIMALLATGDATQFKITRATQAFPRNVRDAVLSDLVESGVVLRLKAETDGRPRTLFALAPVI